MTVVTERPLTRRIISLLPPLAASPDAGALAGGLRGLAGGKQRRAFVRTAQAVIDWRGQTVSTTRQLGLLRDMPVLVAWNVGHHHSAAPPSELRLTHTAYAVMVEINGAGHFPHEVALRQLLDAMDTLLTTTAP